MINLKRWLFPLLIVLIAGGIIFYQFPNLPKQLALDEVEFAKLALSLDGKPFSPYNTMATGHSTLYFYVILLSLKLFGVTSFALRLPSVIAGVGCGLLFYLIMKMVFKKEVIAFISALVLITSRWFFGFARFAFEPTFLLFLELFSIYFFFRYIDKPKRPAFFLIISGIFAGLAYNSYTPGRIFFLLPLLFLIFFLRKKLYNFKNFITLKTLLYFLIPFVILIVPLQSYLFTHEDIRVNQLFFLSNPKLSIQQKADFLGQNVSKTVGMFFIKGDSNGKHNYPYKPALNPILGLLFIAGIIIALKQIKKNHYSLFFILYSIVSILPTLLVYPWENPSMLRTYTVLPAISYFVLLPIFVLVKTKKFSKKNSIIVGFAILLLLSSFYELRTYFMYQSLVFNQSFEVKRNLNDAIKCPNVIECKELPK
jgi:4-amino-4-deoxy-L-arabinose transferase-like glycosyltransferase